MRGLTLTQPYATLVALSEKKIETRSWSTRYRGPIAIHAGAGLGPVGGRRGLADLAMSPPFFAALKPAMMRLRQQYNRDGEIEEWPEFDPALLPLGAIVAVATLVSVHRINATSGVEGFNPQPLASEIAFGNYAPGRYAWLLADIRPLRSPVPCRGALGLWRVPAEIHAQIGAQL